MDTASTPAGQPDEAGNGAAAGSTPATSAASAEPIFIISTVESVKERIDKMNYGTRRPKCKTTNEQVAILWAAFEKDMRPSKEVREELALKLGMSPRAVQVWFQNRRAKHKEGNTKPPVALQAMIAKGQDPASITKTTFKDLDGPTNT
ncbi:hypothetical protein HK101_005494, partial [Irineochytrium annulatum]